MTISTIDGLEAKKKQYLIAVVLAVINGIIDKHGAVGSKGVDCEISHRSENVKTTQ